MRAFAKKKQSAFSGRIEGLGKELKALNREIRTLTKQAEKAVGGPLPTHSTVRRAASSGGSGAQHGLSGMVINPDVRGPLQQRPRDMFDETSQMVQGGRDMAQGPGDRYETRVMERRAPQLNGDEQFASYFMTGGLDRQVPLRQERNTQRNKAIFLMLFFLLILVAVIYTFFSK